MLIKSKNYSIKREKSSPPTIKSGMTTGTNNTSSKESIKWPTSKEN